MKKLLHGTVIAALVVTSAPAAFAAPPDDGCARGFEAWDVTNEPYQADDAADGDGDGWVCARQLGVGASTSLGVDFPIYVFFDNTLLH